MRIGILDIDFLFNYYSCPRLNVEIMKMCEYYNNLFDTSALLLDLHADFNQYDKIIVVSDRTFVERDLQQRIAASSAEIEYYGAIWNNYHYMPLPKVVAEQQIHTKYYKDLVMHYPKIKMAVKKEVLAKHYIRIYAFGEDHIDLKTILNDEHHYIIVDTDLLDKPNIKNEVLIYLMMFPKKFSFMYPITITTFDSFELYMQLKTFNCAGEQVEFVLDNYEEWKKIVEKYKDTLTTHFFIDRERSVYRIGYDKNNCYDKVFFENDLLNLLKIVKLNLQIGLIRKKYIYWDFVRQLRSSGYFAVYREIARFSHSYTMKQTSFQQFLEYEKKQIPIVDWKEFKHMWDNQEQFKKEAQEEIIIGYDKKEEQNGRNPRKNRSARSSVEIWD